MRRTIPIVAALLALGVAAPTALAVDYPGPENPKPSSPPPGKGKTLKVCPKLTKKAKKAGCKFDTVQKAVNKAKAGDKIKIADGVYGEGVIIKNPKQKYLTLEGNVKNPQKVMFDKKKIKKSAKTYNDQIQNAVAIIGVNEVTLNGLAARNYVANGFFVTKAFGYTFNNLWAQNVGVYGIYAFHSIGGTMKNSEASYNNDAGFYIGETPVQDKPKPTIVTNIKSWGNVLGWSGTNMKYVTITKSKFYNNGTGLVPNALKTEKFAPPEFNVITDNDIFWNNYNYIRGKIPFALQSTSTGGIPYPIGVGVLLFGSQNTKVTNNRIYGNYIVGAGMLQQLVLANDEEPVDKADPAGKKIKDLTEWYTLRNNEFTGNVFGNGGKNPNGRGIFYDGNGTGNCISGNIDAEQSVPADAGTFAPCPFTGNNVFNGDAQGTALSWVVAIDRKDPKKLEESWIKGTQQPIPGFTQLEHGKE